MFDVLILLLFWLLPVRIGRRLRPPVLPALPEAGCPLPLPLRRPRLP